MAFCVKKVGFWGKKEGLVVKIVISGQNRCFCGKGEVLRGKSGILGEKEVFWRGKGKIGGKLRVLRRKSGLLGVKSGIFGVKSGILKEKGIGE